jgi:hypothetical protein
VFAACFAVLFLAVTRLKPCLVNRINAWRAGTFATAFITCMAGILDEVSPGIVVGGVISLPWLMIPLGWLVVGTTVYMRDLRRYPREKKLKKNKVAAVPAPAEAGDENGGKEEKAQGPLSQEAVQAKALSQRNSSKVAKSK